MISSKSEVPSKSFFDILLYDFVTGMYIYGSSVNIYNQLFHFLLDWFSFTEKNIQFTEKISAQYSVQYL